jgi:MFS family permease
VALGGFLMTCTVGPASAVVIDVVHPGVRATGAAVLSLFQNLLGLSLGPLLAGALSDHFGLGTALTLVPLLGVVAALMFVRATANYENDMGRVAAVRMRSAAGDGE